MQSLASAGGSKVGCAAFFGIDHQDTKSSLRAEIRALARQRARQLEGVPRSDIVARFRQLTEEIRQVAVAEGMSFPGDWSGD